MELPSPSELFSSLLQPKGTIILFSLAVALLLPILVHITLYRKSQSAGLPSFLIIGPSGSGKTSLVTRLETGNPVATRTSQTPLTIQATLPTAFRAASAQFRSAADPTLHTQPKLLLLDTPGHSKLRHYAQDLLHSPPPSLKGLVFVVDAADLPANSPALRDAAEYLHEVLLLLQKRHSTVAAKGGKLFPVMVAANKMDLFTSLPPAMVQKALELELSEVRSSQEKGLLDSGANGEEAEREWLGEGGESVFAFDQMLDGGVEVSVVGGSVERGEAEGTEGWWQWMADHL